MMLQQRTLKSLTKAVGVGLQQVPLLLDLSTRLRQFSDNVRGLFDGITQNRTAVRSRI